MQILQNMAVKAKFGGAFAWTVFKLFNFLVRGRGGGGVVWVEIFPVTLYAYTG